MNAQNKSHLVWLLLLEVDYLTNKISAPGTPCMIWLKTLLQSALHHCLQVHLQTYKIVSWEWISYLTQSPHPTLSPISPSQSIQVCTVMPFWSASLNSVDYCLRMDVIVHYIVEFKVHLITWSITALQCISEFTHSHLQVPLKLLSNTLCSQFRYTIGKWVAI